MKDTRIGIIGQGYVGLPLAVEFARHFKVVGFDIDSRKIASLKKGVDPGNEVQKGDILKSGIVFSDSESSLKECNFLIVAVPTPINDISMPDLSYVESASRVVSKNLKLGDVVVYESTVYPGCTEEVCMPILEESGLKCGRDFKIGFSPERISPGEKHYTLTRMVKIVSGMDGESLDHIAEVYGKIIKAGIYRAESIKIAEAAKVIENTQRDLNIALMNELALIFNRMDIDVMKVIDAAASKWNFHRYFPGLVGGHCISVDPHYLLYKAKTLGYEPKVILAGREVSEFMPVYVAEKTILALNSVDKKINGARVLVFGLSFKDNVNDTRNSKIKITIKHLKRYNIYVDAYEPLVSKEEIQNKFGVKNIKLEDATGYDCVIFARNHEKFKEVSLESLKGMMGSSPIIVDVAYRFNEDEAKSHGFVYRRL